MAVSSQSPVKMNVVCECFERRISVLDHDYLIRLTRMDCFVISADMAFATLDYFIEVLHENVIRVNLLFGVLHDLLLRHVVLLNI
jgi:hypothetical protein